MDVQTGDIWYNDMYGYHVLLMGKTEPYPSEWRTVYILELGEYNWYCDDDFKHHNWTKVA